MEALKKVRFQPGCFEHGSTNSSLLGARSDVGPFQENGQSEKFVRCYLRFSFPRRRQNNQVTEKYLPPPPREQEKKIFRGKHWPPTVDMEML